MCIRFHWSFNLLMIGYMVKCGQALDSRPRSKLHHLSILRTLLFHLNFSLNYNVTLLVEQCTFPSAVLS